MNIEPYKYQSIVINKIKNIYNTFPKDQRAVLKMPTGTGKTFTALLAAIEVLEGKEQKTCIWLSHQTALSEQSNKELFELIGKPVPSRDNTFNIVKYKNITFKFGTWQGFRNNIKKADMLVIDEVHCGASKNDGNHKSFKKILKKGVIEKHLYVSATPFDLDPDLFTGIYVPGKEYNGFKPERLAELTKKRAAELGLLCNVELRKFISADTFKLRHLETEHEDQFESDTNELIVKILKDKKVNVKHEESIKNLKLSIRDTLVETYFNMECQTTVPPTMIFCTSIDSIDDPLSCVNVVKTLQQKAIEHFGIGTNTGKSFAYYCHSRLENDDSTDVLDEFRHGKIKILCVVGMAREGFNYPKLEVGIDFTPAINNTRLAEQKIGRFCRFVKGKSTSRYYYVDNISSHIKINGVSKVIDRDQLQARLEKASLEHTQEEVEEIARALEDNIQVQNSENSDSFDDNEPSFNGIETPQNPLDKPDNKKNIKIIKTGYIISDAQNVKMKMSVKSWYDILRTPQGSNDSYGNKQKLLEIAKRGDKRPSTNSKDPEEKRLGTLLHNYTHPNSNSYDKEFAKHFKKLRPDWFLTKEDKWKQIYEWSEKNKKRPSGISKDPEERRFQAFLNNKRNSKEIIKYNKKYPKLHKNWNIELIKQEAKKYKTKKEFVMRNNSAYVWTLRNNKIDEVCSHMKKYFICNEINKIYNNQTKATNELKLPHASINQVLRGKNKSTGGLTFRYLTPEEIELYKKAGKI